MWGKIAVDKTGRKVGGWLVGSWSVGAAPNWIPTMHYYSREDGKFYFVRPNIALAKMDLNVDQEDTDSTPNAPSSSWKISILRSARATGERPSYGAGLLLN
jgi:hypothetical protein